MNINNLPYLSAYKHRLQAASAISSSPVTVSSRRTTDVSEIKQQPLTPLDRLFEEIQKMAVENTLNPNSDSCNYLLLRDAYMEENISPQSPSRSEIMAILSPLAEQMSLAKASGWPTRRLPRMTQWTFSKLSSNMFLTAKSRRIPASCLYRFLSKGMKPRFPSNFPSATPR